MILFVIFNSQMVLVNKYQVVIINNILRTNELLSTLYHLFKGIYTKFYVISLNLYFQIINFLSLDFHCFCLEKYYNKY